MTMALDVILKRDFIIILFVVVWFTSVIDG